MMPAARTLAYLRSGHHPPTITISRSCPGLRAQWTRFWQDRDADRAGGAGNCLAGLQTCRARISCSLNAGITACGGRGRWGRRTSVARREVWCQFMACCRSIPRPRRCARTSSGRWPGFLACPSACPGSASRPRPGTLRGELNWQARPGTAGAITSALAGWNRLRFEVTEEASPGCDAVRYSYTPDARHVLGGDQRQRGHHDPGEPAARGHDGGGRGAVRGARGQPPRSLEAGTRTGCWGRPRWDAELEPFRCAAEGAPVRWLHATG